MKKYEFNYRINNFLGFLVCALMMGYALFAEHVQGYAPCPLCVFQRVMVIAAGFGFLIVAVLNPKYTWLRIIGGLLPLVPALGGVAIAARHVWLQSLPEDEVPSCGAGLEFMLDTMPLTGVVQKVLAGGKTCATIDWQFLGMSMPMWVLISCSLLVVWCVYLMIPVRVKKV